MKELKETIKTEIEAIWSDEPNDVRRMRRGFYPSGAGVYNQYFSVLVMAGSEARNLAIHSFSNLVALSESDSFSLEQLKIMTREILRLTAGVIGYFGLERLGMILNSFLNNLDEIETKSELQKVFKDLFTLSNRYQLWLYQTFPWHLSVFFQKNSKEQVEEDIEIVKQLK
jgi:hypothetical protein